MVFKAYVSPLPPLDDSSLVVLTSPDADDHHSRGSLIPVASGFQLVIVDNMGPCQAQRCSVQADLVSYNLY